MPNLLLKKHFLLSMLKTALLLSIFSPGFLSFKRIAFKKIIIILLSLLIILIKEQEVSISFEISY